MKLTLQPRPVQEPAPVLDWSTTPLARDYNGSYVKVIDDLFTPDECDALIALAESDAKWAQAAVHYGVEAHQQYVDTDYRNSERILRFDHEAAEAIFQRISPHVQELVEIAQGDPWETIVSPRGRIKGTWKLVGMNERLSYLRYGSGQYFRHHCDGQLELPDGRISRVTIQVYLGNDDVKGGATRFQDSRSRRYYDVEPKKGRVLIFQQRNLWHSGEDVIQGLKYTLRSDLMFRQSLVDEQPTTSVEELPSVQTDVELDGTRPTKGKAKRKAGSSVGDGRQQRRKNGSSDPHPIPSTNLRRSERSRGQQKNAEKGNTKPSIASGLPAGKNWYWASVDSPEKSEAETLTLPKRI